MELWIGLILLVVALILSGIAFWLSARRNRQRNLTARPEPPRVTSADTVEADTTSAIKAAAAVAAPAPAPAPAVAPPPAKPSPKLSQKLSKTSGLLAKFFQGPAGKRLETSEWDELEEALLQADVGTTITGQLLNRVKERLKESENNGRGVQDLMREESLDLIEKGAGGPFTLEGRERPYVISIVGVNGVGKTTTIGKLAHHFRKTGFSVLLGAADTFRAAAIQQLKVWADRSNAEFVTGREGADPGAVAFDAATAAKARGVDILLLDTAGRLHNKVNLMDELKKVHRVIKKVLPNAPHETWLIVDGTLGQNSIQQAREFQKMLELTGIVVTKLDGTAKGGAVLAVTSELHLPVRFIGVGESAEDLIPFDAKNFVEAIFS